MDRGIENSDFWILLILASYDFCTVTVLYDLREKMGTKMDSLRDILTACIEPHSKYLLVSRGLGSSNENCRHLHLKMLHDTVTHFSPGLFSIEMGG